ncbi:MAG: nucleotidyltransferase domain-containing protein [Proteobacteria bacterium]|nr:nucleotidyltransferase domain-containing protein [Pseudomonadota bacterium]MBU4471234.1 nucleotidyltransferase domain-containing protein [Pseudomonadota bacterium]MCG2753208.1 nucleotidyltransferase domain-containing protein [Desulfobacteraceae bacterium]
MEPKLTAEEILRQLRADKTFLNHKFGVIDIGLFGSFAKGLSGLESDIDLIVELKEPKFEWLAGLQVYLEGKFNRKIELIRKGSHINESFASRIKKETLYA